MRIYKYLNEYNTKKIGILLSMGLTAWQVGNLFAVDLTTVNESKWFLDMRLRNESVVQAGKPERASANTLRTRLGYETAQWNGLGLLIEGENISTLGDENFDNTLNGKSSFYPTIADPWDNGINRLQITYTGIPQTQIITGRQWLNLDNQRFVGAVSWRQNDQTFDAISFRTQSLKDWNIFYAYAHQVNRIFGQNSTQGVWKDTDIHLVNIAYSGLEFGKWIAYNYLLNIPSATNLSSSSLGIRFEGKWAIQEHLSVLLNLELAKQNEFGNNPNKINCNYFVFEPSIILGSWTAKYLHESIEGDGTNSMQFPLGTNHAFDGWADKFLTTPANGLIDSSVAFSYVHTWNGLTSTKFQWAYHQFSAQKNGSAYGNEWNVVADHSFNKEWLLGIKWADYESKGFATNTSKVMSYLQFKL